MPKAPDKNPSARQSIYPWLLIGLGVVLLLSAGLFILDSLTSAEPASLGRWLFDVLLAVLGAGASIQGWKGVFKKDTSKTGTQITAMDEAQVATGEQGRNIRQGENSKYIEKVEHYYEAPAPTPELHDTIGFIPPAKTVTYVHRGKIEDDVREFLKNGGTGAIVGLHAPGGLGKTELAKHAAEDLRGDFEGVLWIDVGEKQPHQVIGDMLMKCGVQTQPGASYEQMRNELHHVLKERRFLIILDDVRAKALAGLDDFLPPKPCSALITSRIQQIGGVQKTFMLDHLTEAQADELLKAILGDETVNAEKELAEKLAMRCAFNPLALEIAARRIRQWQGMKKPIAHYFETIHSRFRGLKLEGDARWDMERVFDMSYEDLSAEDQKRFRALAVFAPTGFSPAAAAHLWGLDEGGAGEVIARFVNLSLLKFLAESKRERYRLHDLLDEYAEEKLKKDEKEEREARGRMADWLVGFYNELYVPDIENLNLGLIEKDNLLKACAFVSGYKDGNRLAQLTTRTLNWFNVHFVEHKFQWLSWLESCLQFGIDDSTHEGKQLKANVLQAIGDVQQFRDERDAALESYNAALTLFRQVGDKLGEANVYLSLGGIKRSEKNLEGAKDDFQHALEIYRFIGDQYSQGRALYRLGDCEADLENYKGALECYEKAEQLWNAIGVTDLVNNILAPRIRAVREKL